MKVLRKALLSPLPKRAAAAPVLLATLLATAGCRATAGAPEVRTQAPPGPDFAPGTAGGRSHVSSPGADGTEANWKERLESPYVYVEHRGDYRDFGAAMRDLFAATERAGLRANGPPFALFYDDPGEVALADLYARACLPISSKLRCAPAGLSQDVLPRAMVVYTRVAGAYPEVSRAYPALFGYLQTLGWSPGGPVREVYLVDPGTVADYSELVTEVQIPWVAGAFAEGR